VPHSASLCQPCRHVAAEALRRAAAATRPALDEEQHRKQVDDEEQRQLEAREDEREQLRKQEQARLLALEDAARRRKEEARRLQAEEEDCRRSEAAAAFDPFTVLGVPRDTSPDDIRSAYQEAKLKYDLDQVAHLSNEVQQLFKAKIQAVERAYEMLEDRR
jgi:DnaJ-domain-containing protein 1